jgi:hypothetical protein
MHPHPAILVMPQHAVDTSTGDPVFDNLIALEVRGVLVSAYRWALQFPATQ